MSLRDCLYFVFSTILLTVVVVEVCIFFDPMEYHPCPNGRVVCVERGF